MLSPLARPARTRLGRLAVFVSSLLVAGAMIVPAVPVAAVNTNSHDGGWARQFISTRYSPLFVKVAMVDATHAYAVGGYWDNGPIADIYGTSDGGATWTELFSLADASFVDIAVADSTHVYVAGNDSDGGVLYGTSNGGANWSKISSSVPYTYSSANFAGMAVAPGGSTIYAVGQDGGYGATWVSNDGGSIWSEPPSSLFPENCDGGTHLYTAVALDATHAFVGGEDACNQILLLTTSNAGADWTQVTLPSTTEYHYGEIDGGAAIDATHAYAVGRDRGIAAIYTTADAGATWSEYAGPASGVFHGATAPDTMHAYAVGEVAGGGGALIYSTSDGGATWSSQGYAGDGPGANSWFTGVAALDAGDALVVGSDSNDNGASFIYGLTSGHTADAPNPYNAYRSATLGGVVGNVYYYAFNAGDSYGNSETDICAWNVDTHAQVQLNADDPNGCQAYDGQINALGAAGGSLVAVATPDGGDPGSYVVNLADGTLGSVVEDLSAYGFSSDKPSHTANGHLFVQTDADPVLELGASAQLEQTYVNPQGYAYGIASDGTHVWISGTDGNTYGITTYSAASGAQLSYRDGQFASGQDNDTEGLAYANGYLWAVGNDYSQEDALVGRIAQIDPATGNVIHTWSNFIAPFDGGYLDNQMFSATLVGNDLYVANTGGLVAVFDTSAKAPLGIVVTGQTDWNTVLFPTTSGVLSLSIDLSADNRPVRVSASDLLPARFLTNQHAIGKPIVFSPTSPIGSPISYWFNFGDGSNPVTVNTAPDDLNVHVTHTYASGGTYFVTMTAVLGTSSEAIAIQNLSIDNEASSSAIDPGNGYAPPAGGFPVGDVGAPIIGDTVPGNPPIENPPVVIWTNPGNGPHDTSLYPVQPGQVATATGHWYLQGHYADLTMCFVVNGTGVCAPIGTGGKTAALGSHDSGALPVNIGWSAFSVTDTAPAGTSGAYLEWTAGSDSGISDLSWSTSDSENNNPGGPGTPVTAASGIAVNCYEQLHVTGEVAGCVATPAAATTTLATVDAMIQLDGVPATIDYGHGVPYATLTPTPASLVVTSNSEDGYTLDAIFNDLTPTEGFTSPELPDTIPASDISWTSTAGGTSGHFADGVSQNLATQVYRSPASGDTYDFSSTLAVPFVNSGAYTGTATFSASTLL